MLKLFPKHLCQIAQEMLFELETNKLIVVKKPNIYKEKTERGVDIRSVESRNPSWYRQICEKYPSNRKKPRKKRIHDTKIKRQTVLNILGRLGNKKGTASYLYNDLLNIAKDKWDVPF